MLIAKGMLTLAVLVSLAPGGDDRAQFSQARAVTPPNPAQRSKELNEEEAAALPVPKQPKDLADALAGLSEGTIEERIAKLRKKVLSDLVFIEGGSYMMGDFGTIWLESRLRISAHDDDKPVHKVTINSFSISKYKTTYAEYDVFTDGVKKPRLNAAIDKGIYRYPTIPAGVYWHEARDYCQWLGKITGEPFDLPYEAEWEYAGRSRGQFFMMATDDGNIDEGRNIASSRQITRITPVRKSIFGELPDAFLEGSSPIAIALFPPSPLGLYDMSYNGEEWMNDWYEANYYKKSPEENPHGPKTGKRRVTRSYENGNGFQSGMLVLRFARDPMLLGRGIISNKIEPGPKSGSTVRCVVRKDQPVNH